jgi:hypothetical protein
MPSPTPDAWAQIRHAYEHSRRTVEDICLEHGITANTLRRRGRRWGWTMRQQPIPDQGPPPLAMPAVAVEPVVTPSLTLPHFVEDGRERPFAWGGSETDAPADPAATAALIAERLQGALARVLPAIETTLARLTAPQHPRDTEQAARTLGVLMRTLRELNTLAGQHAPQSRGDTRDDDDPVPEDIDEFRRELARRINAFVDERQTREANERESND